MKGFLQPLDVVMLLMGIFLLLSNTVSASKTPRWKRFLGGELFFITTVLSFGLAVLRVHPVFYFSVAGVSFIFSTVLFATASWPE
jgi:hypothetical protein